MSYSGLSTITIAEPRWRNPRTLAVANVSASWQVSGIGLLSAMLPTRQAALCGIAEFKERWVRWDHHTMGAWAGVVKGDPADLFSGTIELSCQSLHVAAKKRTVGFRTNPIPSPPGSLVLRAFADANVDRDVPFDEVVADEDGPLMTMDFRGDDLFDLVDSIAQSSGYEYDVELGATDNRLTFAFRRQIGSDKRGQVLIAEGREVLDGTVQPDTTDLVNSILAVSSDDQWADVDRTRVIDPDSKDAYGELQETRQYDYAVRKNSLRTRAELDLVTSAQPAIPVTLRLPDRAPVLAKVRHGDTVRFWCASKNKIYDLRVTSRSVDVDEGIATIGGFATEAA